MATVVPSGATKPNKIIPATTSSIDEDFPCVADGNDVCVIGWNGGARTRAVPIGLDGNQDPQTLSSSYLINPIFPGEDLALVSHPESGTLLALWILRTINNPPVYQVRGVRWDDPISGPSDPSFQITGSSRRIWEVACAAMDEDDFTACWIQSDINPVMENVVSARLMFIDDSSTDPVSLVGGSINPFDEEKQNLGIAALANGLVVSYENESSNTWSILSDSVGSASLENLDSIDHDSGPGFAGSAIAASGIDNRFLRMWIKDGTPPSLLVEAMEGQSGSYQPLPTTGCPDGGEARVGTAVSPNPFFKAELWGKSTGTAYLAVGDAPLNIPIGSSILVPDPTVTVGYLAGFLTTNSYISVDLPIPPGLSGASAWLQWIVLENDTSCTGYPAKLSDAVMVTLD